MTLQFKIQIKGITKPPVWRRVQVSDEASFAEFHEVIQLSFGWTFSHLYLFSEKGFSSNFQIQDIELADFELSEVGDADKIKLKDIFYKEKQTYIYIYDFGDNWEHKITLEKIINEKIKHPICLTGKGQCPPEDCGSTWGFAELKEAINDPEHPEFESFREWIGLEGEDQYNPKEFDLEEVNEVLTRM